VIVDEAGLNYLSLAFNTDRNKLLRKYLMIVSTRTAQWFLPRNPPETLMPAYYV